LIDPTENAEVETPPDLIEDDPLLKEHPALYDAILVAYQKYQHLPLEDRLKIPKLKWNKQTKRYTQCASQEAAKIAKQYNINTFEDLNALYYATAITVSPPVLVKNKNLHPEISPTSMERMLMKH